MTRDDLLERARDARERHAWGEAHRLLAEADRQGPLPAGELEQLAEAAQLLGKQAECAEALTRAHRDHLEAGEPVGAARCAFWLAFSAFLGGGRSQAGGWLSRARRLLEEDGGDHVERGYVLALGAIHSFGEGDVAAAQAGFREVAGLGQRFGDPNLQALALCGQGRTHIRRGAAGDGLTLLDESMVALQAGQLSPWIAGGLYCAVIEACGEVYDLGRAQEWTAALERWCRQEPEVVPYRGQCLVHRAELLLLHGAWPEALAEARRACEWLSLPRPGPAAAAAHHLLGTLHRLRGELPQAEEAFQRASRWERLPHAGLALLRLAQGQLPAARAAIGRVAAAVRGVEGRAPVLDAAAEIFLAAGDLAAAREAAEELSSLGDRLRAPLLRALAARARGAILLAEGDARAAGPALRQALSGWRELEAPYEAARAQVLLAQACRASGEGEAAEQELAAARRVFEGLEAGPDLARADALRGRGGRTGPLTPREVQVLALVASGRSNRAIAGALGISEKTVARHLSNIFGKLDLPSRAAATAYAFRHDLV